jgi:integrase
MTFGEVADALIASMSPTWRNAKHRAQLEMTLKTYCAPIRSMNVNAIGPNDVLRMLEPIWQSKAETASRLRGRVEKVLDFAKARGMRSGKNPALWRGHLDALLPKRAKLTRGHHKAMPFDKVPAFLADVRQKSGVSARALEFCVLHGGAHGRGYWVALGRNRLWQ